MQAFRPAAQAALVASTLLTAGIDDAQAQPATPAADAGVTLVHRFTLPAGLAWGEVWVSLSPQAWRIGHADGRVASAAQVRSALGRLASVEIGGRCAGWVEGATAYPCGFAVGEAGLAGSAAGERFSAIAIDLESPAERRHARLPGTDTPEFRASGLIAPVLDAARLVTVKVPPRFVGRPASAGDGSAELRFRIRAVSNPLVPSQFERATGTVILRGTGEGEIDAATPASRSVI